MNSQQHSNPKTRHFKNRRSVYTSQNHTPSRLSHSHLNSPISPLRIQPPVNPPTHPLHHSHHPPVVYSAQIAPRTRSAFCLVEFWRLLNTASAAAAAAEACACEKIHVWAAGRGDDGPDVVAAFLFKESDVAHFRWKEIFSLLVVLIIFRYNTFRFVFIRFNISEVPDSMLGADI